VRCMRQYNPTIPCAQLYTTSISEKCNSLKMSSSRVYSACAICTFCSRSATFHTMSFNCIN
jgi:hypothetical protein